MSRRIHCVNYGIIFGRIAVRLIGLFAVIGLVLLALLADVIAPHSAIAQYREATLVPPMWQEGGSSKFILGTDPVGRDMLSRLIHGTRLSLFIGLVSVTLSLSIGVVLGLLAGFFRGGVEVAIMRLMDIMLALPSLLLAIAVVAILGPGLMNAMYAIAIVMLPHFARLTRAAVIGEVSKDYVNASRIAGAGNLRLMVNCILPNCAAPLDRADHTGVFQCHSGRGSTRFSWPRRTAADAGMGFDAVERSRIYPERLVGGDFSRPGDFGFRAGF